jgi:hypothetical protein
MVKASCLEGNIQSCVSGSSLLVAAAKTRRANVMLLIDGSKSLVVALIDLSGSSQLRKVDKERDMSPIQEAKVGHQRVHIGILAFALRFAMDSRPNGRQRVFPVWLFGRRWFRLMLSHRCFSGSGISQSSFKLLDAKFQSCDVAFSSVNSSSSDNGVEPLHTFVPFLEQIGHWHWSIRSPARPFHRPYMPAACRRTGIISTHISVVRAQ